VKMSKSVEHVRFVDVDLARYLQEFGTRPVSAVMP
jgi:hypothetical protein